MSNVPKLRFREFSGDWEEKKLGNIATFFNSKRIPLTESDRKNGIYPYYGASGIIDYVENYIFDGEYILLGEDGANIIMRNSRLVFIAKGKFWVNNHAHIFQAKESNTFLCEALERIDYTKYNTGTAQPKLNSDIVKKIKLLLPSKPEQEKIASFLSTLDTKIEQLSRKAKLLEEYKKGVMQKIFSQEIRFKDDNGSDYPEWVEKKLESFLNLTLREVPKPEENYLSIGVRSHCKGTFQKPDSEPHKIAMDKLYLVKENDLIVSITFAWESAIAIVKKEDENGLVSHRFPTYTFNNKVAVFEFFKYVIIQKEFRFMLELISPGGAGRNRVMSKKDFLKLLWTMPSVLEQTKIANFLSSIDEKLLHVNKQLDSTKEFKKALLQQMFV